MSRRRIRLLLVGSLFTVAALLLGVYVLRFAEDGHGIPCPLLLLTGWSCPACGMTRAASSLLRGDAAAAFARNALWPLYAAYLLWVAAADALCYVRHGRLQLLPRPRWVHGIMLAAALGYGVLRNLL